MDDNHFDDIRAKIIGAILFLQFASWKAID
jgi:hypothetical protein